MSTMEMHRAPMSARDWAQALVPYRRASAARGLFELAVTVLPFVALWAAMLIAARAWPGLAIARHGAAGGRAARSPVHDPARLRPRLVPAEQSRKRVDRSGDRRRDDDPLRSLAALPCDPSCDIWQSRPARHRRHQDADGSRIFRAQLARPAPLPALSPSSGDVRDRPGLSVPDREPLAFRLHAQGRDAMGQHDDDQRGHPAGGRPPHLERRPRGRFSWSLCRSSCSPRPPASGCSTCSISSRATTWRAAADWSQPEAALHGSSHYRLPPPLRWFSANIGVHHVHHLASGIPFYRLPEVLRNHPALGEVGRLGLWRASPASAWRCGTRTRNGSFRFARPPNCAGRPSASCFFRSAPDNRLHRRRAPILRAFPRERRTFAARCAPAHAGTSKRSGRCRLFVALLLQGRPDEGEFDVARDVFSFSRSAVWGALRARSG